MPDFQPIVTDLQYEDDRYRSHSLNDVDISTYLLAVLINDEYVIDFNAAVDHASMFGEAIQADSTVDNDGYPFMPGQIFHSKTRS